MVKQATTVDKLMTDTVVLVLFLKYHVAPGPSFLITKHQPKLYLEQAVMVNWVEYRTFTQETGAWILAGRHDSTVHLLCYSLFFFFFSIYLFSFSVAVQLGLGNKHTWLVLKRQ